MSDLISRDAAIRILCDLEPHTCDLATCGLSCQSVAAIKALPDALPPHGRLIDADALLARFEKESSAADAHGRDFSTCFMRGLEPCAEWWAVERIVMDAPTIVAAEEGEVLDWNRRA